MKSLIVLGAGQMQCSIIRKIRELGHKSIVCDINPNSPGVSLADEFYEISTMDYESILDLAVRLKIDGILTTSDAPIVIVSKVSEKLGLKGPTFESTKFTTNKYLLRSKLKSEGIKTPWFYKIDNLDEFKRISDKITFPFIIKPVDSSASRGVSIVKQEEDFGLQFKDTLEYSKQNYVLIEEFIKGREYSVETLTQNDQTDVIAITEKTLFASEHSFVESRHVVPANLPLNREKEINSLVKQSIQALGLNSCPTHTEVILTEKGPYIIEIAARLGGDFITSDLVPLATGVDMERNLISLTLGEPIQTEKTKNAFAGVQFLDSDLISNNNEKLNNLENIFFAEFPETNSPASKVVKNSLDRCGYYICVANDYNTLIKRLDLI